MKSVRSAKFVVTSFVVVACFAAVCLSPLARAAVLLEEGPNYHVIEYDAGGGEAGSVALRIEFVSGGSGSDTYAVKTSIASVNPAPHWTYSVRKSGGINSAVEVDFESDYGCSTTFKAKYVPGKTVVDGGEVKCR